MEASLFTRKLDEVGLNIELTELCALWTVEYRKGGWQKAHRHSDQDVKKISAVCYLTEPMTMMIVLAWCYFCLFVRRSIIHMTCATVQSVMF